jgi:hypothetical protein
MGKQLDHQARNQGHLQHAHAHHPAHQLGLRLRNGLVDFGVESRVQLVDRRLDAGQLGQDMGLAGEALVEGADSTGRRNGLFKSLSWRFIV